MNMIRCSNIFTTFEKIYGCFINNFKTKESKTQIKTHLSYLANSYFYNCKLSSRILRFLRKLKHKNFFTENEYDNLYPSGAAAARICGTRKMH